MPLGKESLKEMTQAVPDMVMLIDAVEPAATVPGANTLLVIRNGGAPAYAALANIAPATTVASAPSLARANAARINLSKDTSPSPDAKSPMPPHCSSLHHKRASRRARCVNIPDGVAKPRLAAPRQRETATDPLVILPGAMLEAQDLAARRGHLALFARIAFRLERGFALALSGPNGSGKTTLLRILAGLTEPSAGEVRWNGRAVRPFAPELRADLLYAGHAGALKDEMTAEENLTAATHLAGERHSAQSIRAALDEVGLGSRRGLPARLLSQGQRRRIVLARLVLSTRPLWILDEPLTALDAAAGAWLGTKLSEHLARGGIAACASHQPIATPLSRTRELALDAAAS
jgi:heme exporter protein A